MSCRFTPAAKADLLAIADFISENNPPAAHRFTDDLERHCKDLADTPELGPACSQVAKGLRKLPVGNYIVFYSIAGGDVLIERILHGARNVKAIFD